MGHYSSFVVKVWVDEHEMMSKGYVQHVGTEEAIHFTSLDKMTEFIMSHLSLSQNPLINPDNNIEPNPLTEKSEAKGGYTELF